MTEIQSLARGLKILDLLGQSPDGISITELAETLNVILRSLTYQYPLGIAELTSPKRE